MPVFSGLLVDVRHLYILVISKACYMYCKPCMGTLRHTLVQFEMLHWHFLKHLLSVRESTSYHIVLEDFGASLC